MRIAVYSILLVWVGLSSRAVGQIQSGTIIVMSLKGNRLVMAADSRVTSASGASADDQCKIVEIGDGVLFASSGAAIVSRVSPVDPIEPWDNPHEARKAFLMIPADQNGRRDLHKVVDAWGRRLIAQWQSFYRVHPRVVLQEAARDHGLLTTGVFAGIDGETVILATVPVSLEGSVQYSFRSSATFYTQCGHCILGDEQVVEIVNEFVNKNTLRAKAEAARWAASPRSKGPESDLYYVIRLAQLAVRYDNSGRVGGKIDAVELGRDGKARWHARKATCQATSR